MSNEHAPRKMTDTNKPVWCVCGYGPTDVDDLDQHILASMQLPGDHAESRR
jgi:hypothetical protein